MATTKNSEIMNYTRDLYLYDIYMNINHDNRTKVLSYLSDHSTQIDTLYNNIKEKLNIIKDSEYYINSVSGNINISDNQINTLISNINYMEQIKSKAKEDMDNAGKIKYVARYIKKIAQKTKKEPIDIRYIKKIEELIYEEHETIHNKVLTCKLDVEDIIKKKYSKLKKKQV